MNPNRFFIPGYMGMINTPIYSPAMRTLGTAARNTGLFSRITNGVRSFNWGNLLNNANKTLNVVNQAIPLVRQAGPLVSNMRSMLKIAKVFGNETNNANSNSSLKRNDYDKKKELINHANYESNNSNSNSPNFFI